MCPFLSKSIYNDNLYTPPLKILVENPNLKYNTIVKEKI